MLVGAKSHGLLRARTGLVKGFYSIINALKYKKLLDIRVGLLSQDRAIGLDRQSDVFFTDRWLGFEMAAVNSPYPGLSPNGER